MSTTNAGFYGLKSHTMMLMLAPLINRRAHGTTLSTSEKADLDDAIEALASQLGGQLYTERNERNEAGKRTASEVQAETDEQAMDDVLKSGPI